MTKERSAQLEKDLESEVRAHNESVVKRDAMIVTLTRDLRIAEEGLRKKSRDFDNLVAATQKLRPVTTALIDQLQIAGLYYL